MSPLITGKSPKSFSTNVETEMNAGKPQKQAVAIAYSKKREAEHGGRDEELRPVGDPEEERQRAALRALKATSYDRLGEKERELMRRLESVLRGKARDKWGKEQEQEYFRRRKKLEAGGMSKLRAHEEAMRQMGEKVNPWPVERASDALRPVGDAEAQKPHIGYRGHKSGPGICAQCGYALSNPALHTNASSFGGPSARDAGMGLCPACRRSVQTDGRGLVAGHQGGRAATCPGSGSPPLAANAKDAVERKQTQYFSSSTQYGSLDAHKKAREFLAQKEREGFVGFESTYGNYGFSVTYWKKDLAKDDPRPVSDSFGGLVRKLERGGKSRAYATKIAGKVAAEQRAKAKDREVLPV